MNHLPDRDIEFELAAADAWRRAILERAIVVGLLRCRRRGMAITEATGITADHFDQPDLRVIFVAVQHSRWMPLIETLKSAKRMLDYLHYWDEDVPRGASGMHWSSAALCEAATATDREIDAITDELPGLIRELKNAIAPRKAVAA